METTDPNESLKETTYTTMQFDVPVEISSGVESGSSDSQSVPESVSLIKTEGISTSTEVQEQIIIDNETPGKKVIKKSLLPSSGLNTKINALQSRLNRFGQVVSQLGKKIENKPQAASLSNDDLRKQQAIFVASLAPIISVLIKEIELISELFLDSEFLENSDVFYVMQKKSINFAQYLFLICNLFNQLDGLQTSSIETVVKVVEFIKNLETASSYDSIRNEFSLVNDRFTKLVTSWTSLFTESNTILFALQQEALAISNPLISQVPSPQTLSNESGEETNLKQSVNLVDAVRLAREPSSNSFKSGENTVVKIRFNFKLANLYESSVKYVDLSGIPYDSLLDNPNNLNHVGFDTELYFVILQNDGSISMDDIFLFFNQNFFVPYIQPLLSGYVILECIQVQNFWPARETGSFDQVNYNSQGLGGVEEEIASKPFCLTFTSSLGKSSKNAFKFRIPGVLAKYKNFAELEKNKEKFDGLKTTLSDIICFGPEKNLQLSLVVPTRKADAKLPFLPVTSCSVAGFTGNYKRSLKFRILQKDPKKS